MSFFSDYVEYCEGFTDAPVVFHQRLAYFILSSVVNRRVYIRHGHRNFHPNLWIMILAPSTFYRKSYALSIAKKLVEEIHPDFTIPNNFSTEGLREFMSVSAQGQMIYDEFKDMMANMGKRYNEDAKGFLMESYDCPERLSLGLRAKKKDKKTIDQQADEDDQGTKEKHWIEKPFVNIATASTIDWFRESLHAPDIPGGFLPRFFIVKAYPKTQTIHWLKSDDEDKRKRLIEQLKVFAQVEGEMSVSQSALDYHKEWYLSFEKSRADDTSIMSPFYSRLADEYVKKFAMLNAIERTAGLKIEKQDMASACNFCANSVSELHEILSDLDGGYYSGERRKVEEYLRKRTDQVVPKKEICRVTRIRKKYLDEILTQLEDEGLIKIGTADSTGGRPPQVYTWLK